MSLWTKESLTSKKESLTSKEQQDDSLAARSFQVGGESSDGIANGAINPASVNLAKADCALRVGRAVTHPTQTDNYEADFKAWNRKRYGPTWECTVGEFDAYVAGRQAAPTVCKHEYYSSTASKGNVCNDCGLTLVAPTAPAETSEEETIRIVNAANKDLAEGLAKAKHELAVLHEVASYAWEGVKDVPMLIQPSHRDKTLHHMLTVWRALGTYSTRPDRSKDGK